MEDKYLNIENIWIEVEIQYTVSVVKLKILNESLNNREILTTESW